jgi:hypothetical protein
MTTYTDFTPTATQNFQFQPTLDGVVYTCLVTWNVSAQRWYISCYTLSGQLVVSMALVGSPVHYDINLFGAYFTSSKLVFRQGTQQFEVTP